IGLACAVGNPAQRQKLYDFMSLVSISFLSMHGADVEKDAALECAQRFPGTQILAISQSRNERCVHVLNADAGNEQIAKAMAELQMHADIRRYHALGSFQMGEDRQVERALSRRKYYLSLHGDRCSEALLRAMLASLPSSASIGTIRR